MGGKAKIREITTYSDLQQQLRSSGAIDELVVVHWYLDNTYHASIKKAAERYPNTMFIHCNVKKYPSLAQVYNMKSIEASAFTLFKKEKEVDGYQGNDDKETVLMLLDTKITYQLGPLMAGNNNNKSGYDPAASPWDNPTAAAAAAAVTSNGGAKSKNCIVS